MLLAMLANCHRLGMDTLDAKGNRRPGQHPKPWSANEFLPKEWQVRSRRRNRDDRIEGSIEVLKVFLPPGAEPQFMSRESFRVVAEEET